MKVILAYSGGLDTTVLLTWLQEKYDAEVICYCANVGQEEELDGLEEKALKHGAVKCYVDDVQEAFAKDYIFPMMQANAIYEGTYLLGTSIARPLIAKRMIDIARAEGAEAICHGATGKGNDQVRFELTAYALMPDVKVIAPWRMPEDFPFEGRSDMIQYLEERGIPCSVSASKPYSMDRNMLHISFEGGILEDPWTEPDENMWCMTKPLGQAKDEAEYIEIGFEKGIPVSVNGETFGPAALVKKLNAIGCEHAVGRIDIVENSYTGMKDRGILKAAALLDICLIITDGVVKKSIFHGSFEPTEPIIIIGEASIFSADIIETTRSNELSIINCSQTSNLENRSVNCS